MTDCPTANRQTARAEIHATIRWANRWANLLANRLADSPAAARSVAIRWANSVGSIGGARDGSVGRLGDSLTGDKSFGKSFGRLRGGNSGAGKFFGKSFGESFGKSFGRLRGGNSFGNSAAGLRAGSFYSFTGDKSFGKSFGNSFDKSFGKSFGKTALGVMTALTFTLFLPLSVQAQEAQNNQSLSLSQVIACQDSETAHSTWGMIHCSHQDRELANATTNATGALLHRENNHKPIPLAIPCSHSGTAPVTFTCTGGSTALLTDGLTESELYAAAFPQSNNQTSAWVFNINSLADLVNNSRQTTADGISIDTTTGRRSGNSTIAGTSGTVTVNNQTSTATGFKKDVIVGARR